MRRDSNAAVTYWRRNLNVPGSKVFTSVSNQIVESLWDRMTYSLQIFVHNHTYFHISVPSWKTILLPVGCLLRVYGKNLSKTQSLFAKCWTPEGYFILVFTKRNIYSDNCHFSVSFNVFVWSLSMSSFEARFQLKKKHRGFFLIYY